MGKRKGQTKEIVYKGKVYEVNKAAYINDDGKLANASSKKLIGDAPPSLLEQIGFGLSSLFKKNKGGMIRKRTGHTDFRKGGMVINTTDNRKNK